MHHSHIHTDTYATYLNLSLNAKQFRPCNDFAVHKRLHFNVLHVDSIKLWLFYRNRQTAKRSERKKKTKEKKIEVKTNAHKRCHVDIISALVWIVVSFCYPIHVSHVIQFDCATNNEYTAFHTERDVWAISNVFMALIPSFAQQATYQRSTAAHVCTIRNLCRLSNQNALSSISWDVRWRIGKTKRKHQSRNLIFGGLLLFILTLYRLDSATTSYNFYRIKISDEKHDWNK